MPHYSNQNAGSGTKINSHEDAIKLKLNEAGFVEANQFTTHFTKKGKKIKVKTFQLLTKKTLNIANASLDRQEKLSQLVSSLPRGSYISQPLSSQSFPDFLIRDFDSTIYLVEAKSVTNGGSPVMNDNTPKEHCIYIISSGQYNQNTIVLGEDLMLPSHVKMVEQFHKKLQDEAKLFNQKLAKSGSVFEYYVRPKIQARQGRTAKGEERVEKVNCFTHSDRLIRENKVLSFVK